MTKHLTRIFLLLTTLLSVTGAAAEEPGHMHHHFAQDVDAFHALLAPLWHARPGPERSQNACRKAPEMATLAKDIKSADAAALVSASTALQSVCKGPLAGVDAALFDVHEAFHRLIEAKAPAAKRG